MVGLTKSVNLKLSRMPASANSLVTEKKDNMLPPHTCKNPYAPSNSAKETTLLPSGSKRANSSAFLESLMSISR